HCFTRNDSTLESESQPPHTRNSGYVRKLCPSNDLQLLRRTYFPLPATVIGFSYHSFIRVPDRIDDAIVTFLLAIGHGGRSHVPQRESFKRHAARLRFLRAKRSESDQ
ncbi:hypothetical protein, partial [Burkholderia multivorans]|uniref:hypothetical protein n=1 Tax=Burkholderia multivorans TaxID=87883 RepID=UPI001C61635A